MRHVLRSVIGFLLRLLPPGGPEYVYTKILAPAPLRYVVNRILLTTLPKRIRIQEGSILLNPNDPVVSGALAFGVYERFETEVFRKMLAPGMRVLDIGANIGYYTVIAAAGVGHEGVVVAFEPEPFNAELLRKNVTGNNLMNVHVRETAVADKPGHLLLHIAKANAGKHSIVRHEKKTHDSVHVRSETVDEALREEGLDEVDIIKMDIEGAEFLALQGMRRALESRDLALFTEFSPSALAEGGVDPERMLIQLEQNGFKVFEMRENEETIHPVENHKNFISRFSGEAYSNLLCVKGAFLSYVPEVSGR